MERVLGCVGVEEGGENLIKTMSERRGRKREREREREVFIHKEIIMVNLIHCSV